MVYLNGLKDGYIDLDWNLHNVYMKWNNIWYSIIAHNFFICMLDFLSNKETTNTDHEHTFH